MSRPRGDHAARREELAAAAADVIVARGMERVTLRDVAEALGVTTGTLTHYFTSKDALVAHTKERAFDWRYARALGAAERATGIERLHAVVAEMLPVDAERRANWRLLLAFHGHAIGSSAMRRSHDQRMQRWFTFFQDLVRELAADGALPASTDAASTGSAIALFIEGMATHCAMMEPAPSAEWQLHFARDQVTRLVQPLSTDRATTRTSSPTRPRPS